jgi:hypothetical protein
MGGAFRSRNQHENRLINCSAKLGYVDPRHWVPDLVAATNQALSIQPTTCRGAGRAVGGPT